MILAFLAARYGWKIITLIKEHGHPVIVGIILVLAVIAAAIFYSGEAVRPR